jgi:hypothetical protein
MNSYLDIFKNPIFWVMSIITIVSTGVAIFLFFSSSSCNSDKNTAENNLSIQKEQYKKIINGMLGLKKNLRLSDSKVEENSQCVLDKIKDYTSSELEEMSYKHQLFFTYLSLYILTLDKNNSDQTLQNLATSAADQILTELVDIQANGSEINYKDEIWVACNKDNVINNITQTLLNSRRYDFNLINNVILNKNK